MCRLVLLTFLLGIGCSTMPPPKASFPTPPELLMRPPSQLKTLPKPLSPTMERAPKPQGK